jgi:CTP-dependent riboflavin kinase
VNIWNTRQVAKKRETDVASLVASLKESRENVLRFLDELADKHLAIRGWHASGAEMTLDQMFEQLAQHESGHAKDILTARMTTTE